MKKYLLKTEFGDYNVIIRTSTYKDNNTLAIQLLDASDYFPFATLTVNIEHGIADDQCAYVDINNCPWVEQFIKENNLGHFTGVVGKSGFCTYPLYKFSLNLLSE